MEIFTIVSTAGIYDPILVLYLLRLKTDYIPVNVNLKSSKEKKRVTREQEFNIVFHNLKNADHPSIMLL